MPKNSHAHLQPTEELWTYSPQTEEYYLLRDGKVVDTWKPEEEWMYNAVTNTYYKIKEGKIVGQWRPDKQNSTR